MSVNYRIIQPGGMGRVQIPTTDTSIPGDTENIGVKSPEWMIKMDKILESKVADFEDYAELFGWFAQSARYTSSDIGNNLFTSATLRHSDVRIIIPNGGYAAKLENKMNLGEDIDEMIIVRLGNIKAVKIPLQIITYEVCRIQSFQQELDRLILSLNITKKQNVVFSYGQDGDPLGQTASEVDYSKHTVK